MEITSRKKDIIYISIIGLLMLLIVYQYIRYGEQQEKAAMELEGKEYELVRTFGQLDSLSGELDSRITEIKTLGGNIDSLEIIRAELERDKVDLSRGKKLSDERYAKLQNRLAGFTELLKEKDAQVAELRRVNNILFEENQDLKTTEVALKGQIRDLNYERQELAAKVKQAGDLIIDEVQFTAIGKGNKEYTSDKLKVRQLRKLKIGLDIEKNDLAKVGPKVVYAKIIEPTGSTLYNQGSGSGTFNFKGEDVFFSAKKEFLFDNSGQHIDIEFIKGGLYAKGKYTVEFYSDAKLLATKSFIAL